MTRKSVLGLAILIFAVAGYVAFFAPRTPSQTKHRHKPLTNKITQPIRQSARPDKTRGKATRANKIYKSDVAGHQSQINSAQKGLSPTGKNSEGPTEAQPFQPIEEKPRTLVIFWPSQDTLASTLRNAAEKAVAEIKARPVCRVSIEGHSDNRPLPANAKIRYGDNVGLSYWRAAALATRLIHLGVDPERISVRGFGDTRPRAPNTTPEGRAVNRRVEIRLIPK